MNKHTLLDTLTFRKSLEKIVLTSKKEIIICSPFIKLKALEWLYPKIKTNVNVKIITRLSVNDVYQKVSDFEICQFAIDKGWKIGLIKNLHAKLYVIDKNQILIGSNNLTPKGLGLEIDGNEELSIMFEPNVKSFEIIDGILSKANWLNQNKIDLMNEHLSKNLRDVVDYNLNEPWPKEIYDFRNRVFILFSSNFPDLTPQEFLGGKKTFFLETDMDYENIKISFLNSDVYLWLLSLLKKNKDTQNNFGFLTSKIHKNILDDPLPFRKNIKEITNYLFEWVAEFSDEIKIISHANTKSMILKV